MLRRRRNVCVVVFQSEALLTLDTYLVPLSFPSSSLSSVSITRSTSCRSFFLSSQKPLVFLFSEEDVSNETGGNLFYELSVSQESSRMEEDKKRLHSVPLFLLRSCTLLVAHKGKPKPTE